MKTTADVVIIGGGISGCALAYYLAKAGVKNVVLLEKRYLTSGATGQCAGGLRTLTTSGIKIELAKKSRALFQSLNEDTGFGRNLELNGRGYLILAYSENSLEEIRNTIPFQIERGVHVELMDPEDVSTLFPGLAAKNLLGAAFHREGATINPHLATFAYAQAASNLGASLYTDTEVTDIKIGNGQVKTVATNRGEISTATVVNAAGLAFNKINKMAGIKGPELYVECIDAWITSPVDKIKCPALTISYLDPFFLVSQRKNGNLLLMGNSQNHNRIQDNYRNRESLDNICNIFSFMTRAMPDLKKLQVLRHWLGAIPVSPDAHPILGKTENVDNFFMAGLLCGHGFTLAPMIAKVMADTITREEPETSIESLDLKRFDRGDLLESHGFL